MTNSNSLQLLNDTGQSVAESNKKRSLTFQETRLAEMLAEGINSELDCRRTTGISKPRLAELKMDADFMDVVDAMKAEFATKVMAYGLARLEVRLLRLNERAALVDRLLSQRAEQTDPSSPFYVRGAEKVPGADTGLIVPTLKTIGRGDNQQTIQEWTIDAAVLREIRDIELQAAKEVGGMRQQSVSINTGKVYIGVDVDDV